jgi:hypothetical protein
MRAGSSEIGPLSVRQDTGRAPVQAAALPLRSGLQTSINGCSHPAAGRTRGLGVGWAAAAGTGGLGRGPPRGRLLAAPGGAGNSSEALRGQAANRSRSLATSGPLIPSEANHPSSTWSSRRPASAKSSSLRPGSSRLAKPISWSMVKRCRAAATSQTSLGAALAASLN